jgi:signal transduction histidine kinase
MIENQATLQERNRIAREIHDSVGHALTAQSIQLENAALFLTEDAEKAALYLQKARQLGKEALQNVRQSVATLRNYPLQERSLKILLENLIQEFKRTTGIKIESEIALVSSLSGEMTTALYRVVQEALTNVSKHSEANQVVLSTRFHKFVAELTVLAKSSRVTTSQSLCRLA